ncbi:ATP-binding cassette domain-containing protein, partial [Novacetimonas pomaceti]|uniref:ATP-binding cassette domain-containing protein n=1 Tax=Novacetimonas pomaceti TaxID=2021998 RepID=UPI001C2DA31D
PQDGGTPPPMPVRALGALGRLPHGQAGDHAVRHPAGGHPLAVTGLQELCARPASHLSGGERARMNLARALATDTPVILADEPIAALDPAHALSMMHLFRQQAGQGKGIVVVLHDLVLATRFCDELVLMDDGAV